MLTLLTSCGRTDLLKKTLYSFFENMPQQIDLLLHEDKINPTKIYFDPTAKKFGKREVIYFDAVGQHKSIEYFLRTNVNPKYYLHLEDDWEFENSYDWISESIKIMEGNDKIIKVLARKDSPHPCTYNNLIKGFTPGGNGSVLYGELFPWRGPDNILWHGFSWNPGVTRFDLLQQFMPFKKWEQDVAEDIFNAGYKCVALEKGVYKHIGDGRSTHE